MSVVHHPSSELLLRQAAGTLGRGPSLLASAHLLACPVCREEVGRFEAVGGAMLEGLPPAPMSPDALALALARIERPAPSEPPARRRLSGIDLTQVLAGLPLGPRRSMGPGLWMREILREGGGVTYLLRSGPGVRLPRHSHTGREYVCVLTGGFEDETCLLYTSDAADE